MNSKTNIVIFGILDLAELAWFYICNEYDPFYGKYNKITHFTVSKEYWDGPNHTFKGIPVVPFEDLEQYCPPSEYLLFAPIADNKFRKQIFEEGKERGYEFISLISNKCTDYSKKIGENCFIFEDNTIQPFSAIGNNVIIWSGSHIGHHSNIEDNVFITSHVVISGHCHIKQGAYLGVNSTIRDQTTIGEWSTVGMGSVVTKNIPDNETWIGSPAKKKA